MQLRLPKFTPIEFLVRRKFPDYDVVMTGELLSGRYTSSMSKESKSQRMQLIDEYESELKALSQEKLTELVEAEKAKQQEEIEKKKQDEEKQRFFHQPYTDADFDHWSKASYWSIDEAIALSFGKAPESVDWEKVQKYVNVSQFARNYERLRDLSLRAKTCNQLTDPVLPGFFIAWAKRIDVQFPEELIQKIESRGVLVADWKDMYDKQKEQYDQLLSEKDIATTSGTPDELSASPYWEKIQQLAAQAISDYPEWRKTQKRVQKTGNLQDWLTSTIGADNREAEILKKILSDIYEELK